MDKPRIFGKSKIKIFKHGIEIGAKIEEQTANSENVRYAKRKTEKGKRTLFYLKFQDGVREVREKAYGRVLKNVLVSCLYHLAGYENVARERLALVKNPQNCERLELVSLSKSVNYKSQEQSEAASQQQSQAPEQEQWKPEEQGFVINPDFLKGNFLPIPNPFLYERTGPTPTYWFFHYDNEKIKKYYNEYIQFTRFMALNFIISDDDQNYKNYYYIRNKGVGRFDNDGAFEKPGARFALEFLFNVLGFKNVKNTKSNFTIEIGGKKEYVIGSFVDGKLIEGKLGNNQHVEVKLNPDFDWNKVFKEIKNDPHRVGIFIAFMNELDRISKISDEHINEIFSKKFVLRGASLRDKFRIRRMNFRDDNDFTNTGNGYFSLQQALDGFKNKYKACLEACVGFCEEGIKIAKDPQVRAIAASVLPALQPIPAPQPTASALQPVPTPTPVPHHVHVSHISPIRRRPAAQKPVSKPVQKPDLKPVKITPVSAYVSVPNVVSQKEDSAILKARKLIISVISGSIKGILMAPIDSWREIFLKKDFSILNMSKFLIKTIVRIFINPVAYSMNQYKKLNPKVYCQDNYTIEETERVMMYGFEGKRKVIFRDGSEKHFVIEKKGKEPEVRDSRGMVLQGQEREKFLNKMKNFDEGKKRMKHERDGAGKQPL